MGIIGRKVYRYELVLFAMAVLICSLTGCGVNSGGNADGTNTGNTATGQAIKLTETTHDFAASINTTEAYSCCNDTYVFLLGSSEEVRAEAAKEKVDPDEIDQDIFCQYTLSGELVRTYPIPVDPDDYAIVDIVNVTNEGIYFTIEYELYFAPISDGILDLSAGECIYACEDILYHYYDYVYCDERYICYKDMDHSYHEYDRQTSKALAISSDQADYLVPYDSGDNALVTEGTLALMKMDESGSAAGLYIHQIGSGETTLLEKDVVCDYNDNPEVYAANGRIVYLIRGYDDNDGTYADLYCYDIASAQKEKLMSMPECLPEMNQYQDSIGFSVEETAWDNYNPPYYRYTLMGDRLYIAVPGLVATGTEVTSFAVFHIDLCLAEKKLVYDKEITEFMKGLAVDLKKYGVNDTQIVYDKCYITTPEEEYCYDLTTNEAVRLENDEDAYLGEISPNEFYYYWIYDM
ncbi:MAG: hypothetical protein Q4D32_04585 [Eubacteriales bacterium]|nr:hypothetical protein [Eubacteriales bacterium]